MKKMLIAAAVCAGILTFANVDFAEAADQQKTDVTTIQSATDDTQQFSTKKKDKYDDY